MSEPDDGVEARAVLFGAERAKTFVDAVVAIAMTLLILPLMESVNESASRQESAWTWAVGHTGQLLAFVLSFGIIAMFWIDHHRVFSRVERVSVPLLWITMGWLLSIVWLPVVTAMVGQMSSHDRVLIAMYIGSMILTSALGLCTRLYLRSHPATHRVDSDRLLAGIAAEFATIALFVLALVLALLVPAISYYALFLMFLTGPVQRLFAWMLGVRSPAS